MADGGVWGRQAALYPPSAGMLKRPRTEFDLQPAGITGAPEMINHLARDERVIKDTKALESAYDRYLQNMQASSYASGEASNLANAALRRSIPSVMTGVPRVETSVGRSGVVATDIAPNGPGTGYGVQVPVDAMPRPVRETVPLPPDASNTLYVEGLPPDSRKREVAHIFRPFVGYKEVRLVIKDSKHRGGDPIILCFVDFENPACAATALSALQGYRMDEHDADSPYLRIQFSRFPGPRYGSGPRGRRDNFQVSACTCSNYSDIAVIFQDSALSGVDTSELMPG